MTQAIEKRKIIDLTSVNAINDDNFLIIDDGVKTYKVSATDLAEYINGKSSAQPNIQSDWSEADSESDAYIKNKPTALPASDVYKWAKSEAKPVYTASEVGADEEGSADAAYKNAKAYTDDRITQLIGTSPENLDTIEELGNAISENQTAIDAIENAITNKASADHNHDEAYAAKGSEHTHENKTVLDAITADRVLSWDNKKIYHSLSQIDASYNYTNFSYKLLPAGSILHCSVNSANISNAYQAGLIPINKSGVIFAVNASQRGFVLFTIDSGKMYMAAASNMNTTPISSWKEVATKADMIASYSGLMENTASGYLPDALSVKEGFETVNNNFEHFCEVVFEGLLKDYAPNLNANTILFTHTIEKSGLYYVQGVCRHFASSGRFYLSVSNLEPAEDECINIYNHRSVQGIVYYTAGTVVEMLEYVTESADAAHTQHNYAKLEIRALKYDE